jgi:subtilase family serine protease
LVAFVNEILGRLFVASGDDGGFSFFNAVNVGSPLGQADVAFSASDPNVLAVGGTNLVLKKTFTRAVENAWSGSTDGNSGGSGGGISNIWTIPSWQKGVTGTASQTWKNVPESAPPQGGAQTLIRFHNFRTRPRPAVPERWWSFPKQVNFPASVRKKFL